MGKYSKVSLPHGRTITPLRALPLPNIFRRLFSWVTKPDKSIIISIIQWHIDVTWTSYHHHVIRNKLQVWPCELKFVRGLRSQASVISSNTADKPHIEYDSPVTMHWVKKGQCRLKYPDSDFSVLARARTKLPLCTLETLYIRHLSPKEIWISLVVVLTCFITLVYARFVILAHFMVLVFSTW